MRAFPTVAVFRNVEVMALNHKSYEAHIFVIPKDETNEDFDYKNSKIYHENKFYAGWTGTHLF